MLPEWSILLGQKIVKNAKIRTSKCDFWVIFKHCIKSPFVLIIFCWVFRIFPNFCDFWKLHLPCGIRRVRSRIHHWILNSILILDLAVFLGNDSWGATPFFNWWCCVQRHNDETILVENLAEFHARLLTIIHCPWECASQLTSARATLLNH